MRFPSSTHTQSPVVTVVLCTYQGSRYVEAQLDSLLAQTTPISIHVVDDASTDDTVSRVQAKLRSDVDSLTTHAENLGYVGNFERATQAVLDSGAAYIALSDQDDVWDNKRVEAGMQQMRKLEDEFGSQIPLLVHSDLRMIDATGHCLNNSFLAFRRYRIGSGKNLPIVLGENGVMGNTVLMNRALAEMCLPFPSELHVHDYWIALLAELFGHRAMLNKPVVNYRLHTQNASNTANTLHMGGHRFWQKIKWKTLLQRNFKLPFKEDSRLTTLVYLLSSPTRFPELDVVQQKHIQDFIQYLRFKQSRLASLKYLFCSGVLRYDLLYRARLCVVTLLTQRYRCG